MRWNSLNRSRWWSLLVSLWLVQACSASEDRAPDGLIPEDRMADILTEVHMAEARASRLNLSGTDSSTVVYKRLEKQIFKKFQVDTAAYSKSYAFYSAHPKKMEAVYKQVVESLKKKTEAKKPSRS